MCIAPDWGVCRVIGGCIAFSGGDLGFEEVDFRVEGFLFACGAEGGSVVGVNGICVGKGVLSENREEWVADFFGDPEKVVVWGGGLDE